MISRKKEKIAFHSAQIAISAGFAWILAAAVLSYGVAFLAVLRTRLTMRVKNNTVMQGS